MSKQRFASCFFLVFCVLISGCGGGTNRLGISGTVNFKGKPLDTGIITFTPVSSETPTQGSAMITAGKYSISREQGLQPGKYRVSISSPDGKTPDGGSDAIPGPTGNFASVERIPAEYNQKSKHEVEVKKGDKNSFDYSIP